MMINKLSLQHRNAFTAKELDFASNVNIIYSEKNSTGKTTLIRAILYTIGFPVPDTELISFEDYEFKLELVHNGALISVERKCNLLTVNGQEFDLPVDQRVAHSFLFGIDNADILTNLLGTIYFDQEKGWTLLNRGTIIGINRFNVESFFRGLKEDESDESYQMVERISALNKKIAQYKLMLNVAEYQATLSQDVEHKLDFQTYQQGLNSELLERRIQLQKVEEEISRITDVMKKNKSFSDYIEMKKVYVKNPNGGDPIRVTKNTLFEYDSVKEVNSARKSMLIAERNDLKRQIAKIEASQEKQTTLLNLPTVDAEMTSRLASISGISSIEVNAMLNKFHKEKNKLSDALKIRTKTDNTWITDAYKIISDYAKEIDVPFDYKIDIFTRNLKSKSGTILHKMVFIYKLAYIKLLSQKIGYPVPIFCDSPSGREVKKETIIEMLNLLKRDFSEHQIFIASIYKYEEIFDVANIIDMKGTLFNEPSLLDFLDD